MALVFGQQDAAAPNGEIVACYSGSLGSVVNSANMIVGSPAAFSEDLIQIPASSTRAGYMFEGNPERIVWESGDWTIRFNITTGSNAIFFEELHICRIAYDASSNSTVASDTTMNDVMTATGVKTYTVTQSSDSIGAASDHIYIVLVFRNSSFFSSIAIGIRPNQSIDTPIADTEQKVMIPVVITR